MDTKQQKEGDSAKGDSKMIETKEYFMCQYCRKRIKKIKKGEKI